MTRLLLCTSVSGSTRSSRQQTIPEGGSILSGRVGALSRSSTRLLLAVFAVTGMLAVTAFVASAVGAQQSQTMVASWYGPGFEGATTASGAPFDPYGYTAAHKELPFGTKLIVTYRGNSVVVEINDRGPFIAGRDLDLSQGAAEYIGLTAAGEGVVGIEYADASTPVGPYSGEAASPSESGAASAQPVEEPVATQGGPSLSSQTSTSVAVNDGASEEQYAADEQYADDQPAADEQYADNQPVGGEQYASGDQYAGNQYSNPSAVDDQSEDIVAATTNVIPDPVVPAAGALEIPPIELATPGSTVERRIQLEEAAPPANYVVPEPVEAVQRVLQQKAAPQEAVQQKAAPSATIDEVYEAPDVVTGISVLPDTGGLPLLPISGVAASIFVVGLGVKVLRR